MQTVPELLATLPQVGKLVWIGLRPASRAPLQSVAEAEILAGRGLVGDHRLSRTAGGKRQITLIQYEHLAAVASLTGRPEVAPELLRRNLVVAGLNLLALKGRQFRVGNCLLEYSGPCEPCSRMEEVLGPGGYNAMRGHGGITAKILEGGLIQVGDEVKIHREDAEKLGSEKLPDSEK